MSLVQLLLDLLKRIAICFLAFLTDKVNDAYFPTKKNALPPTSDKLLMQPGWQLVDKIKRGELKSESLVLAYIKRAQEVQPLINAIIQDRFEAALEDARQVDQRVQEELTGQPPRDGVPSIHSQTLLGLPFTVKDSISISGMYFTSGMVHRKGLRASEDSDAVRGLREAGAIPIALTNVPEACMWWDTVNQLYGRTNNPHDLSRIPGGSSGGEGALISSAGSLFGVGSDVGGSIRMPSAFCGVFGHKTTPRIVTLGGVFPEVKPDYNSLGPICRYASDLKPTLKAMAGENAGKLKLDMEVDLAKVKVYVLKEIKSSGLSRVQPRIQEAIKKAVGHLKGISNSKIVEINFEQLENVASITTALWTEAPDTSVLKILAHGQGELNFELECVKWLLGLSKHSLGPLQFGHFEKTAPKKGSDWQTRWAKIGHELRDQILELLGDDGVLITPSHPESAPKHNTTWFKLDNIIYTWFWNVLGVCSTHVPLGTDEENLPVGFQVIAAPNNDHLTIAVAEEMEKVFGGWTSPFITSQQ